MRIRERYLSNAERLGRALLARRRGAVARPRSLRVRLPRQRRPQRDRDDPCAESRTGCAAADRRAHVGGHGRPRAGDHGDGRGPAGGPVDRRGARAGGGRRLILQSGRSSSARIRSDEPASAVESASASPAEPTNVKPRCAIARAASSDGAWIPATPCCVPPQDRVQRLEELRILEVGERRQAERQAEVRGADVQPSSPSTAQIRPRRRAPPPSRSARTRGPRRSRVRSARPVPNADLTAP